MKGVGSKECWWSWHHESSGIFPYPGNSFEVKSKAKREERMNERTSLESQKCLMMQINLLNGMEFDVSRWMAEERAGLAIKIYISHFFSLQIIFQFI